MTLTAAEIKDLCAAGIALRFRPDGTVSMAAPTSTKTGPVPPALRMRALRQRRKVTFNVTPEPETVTNVTPLHTNDASPLAPSFPPPPPQVSPLHPPSFPSAPTHTPPHPYAGGDDELFAVTESPKTPKPKRAPKPPDDPPTDPRHHAITSRIGEAYKEVTGQSYSFNGHFGKALKTFLTGWGGTDDEWLALYSDVLTYAARPFAKLTVLASDPAFLCKNWNAVAAEVDKLKGDESREGQKKPSPIFTKGI